MFVYLVFAVVLERQKVLYDDAGIGAVPHVEGGRAHPCLHLVQRERYVLRKLLVEHPDLAVHGRLRHSMSILMEQHSFVLSKRPNYVRVFLFFKLKHRIYLGVFSKRDTQLFDILSCWVRA